MKPTESDMLIRPVCAGDNAALASLVRSSLKRHSLDIPGTAYYDACLDNLSEYYLSKPEKRAYFVLTDGENVLGGIGIAEFDELPYCAEMQKLYIDTGAQGNGLSYKLIHCAEAKARELGYKRIYLETHTNLAAALHIYESSGYKSTEPPAFAVHGAMNRF